MDKKLKNSFAVCKVASSKWFKCNICEKVFDRKSSLVLHERTHLDDRPLTCKVCQQTFIDRSLLNKHLLTHSDEKSTVCEKGRDIDTCNDLINEYKYELTNDKYFKCHICSKTFKEKAAVQNHLLLHVAINRSLVQGGSSSKITECNESNKILETKDLSARCIHQKSSETCEEQDGTEIQLKSVGKTFECNICQEVLKTANSLSEDYCSHKKSLNSKLSNESSKSKLHVKDDKITFVCIVCQQVFKSESLLFEHYCPQEKSINCETSVSKEKTLKSTIGRRPIHVFTYGKRSNYTGKKSHMCCKCQEVFENKTSLSMHFCTFKSVSHMKTYNRAPKSIKCSGTKISNQNKSLCIASQLIATQFICEICKQHFINKEALAFHLHCHMGDKFVCEDCQTAFDTRKLLEVHRRAIGRKQFLCNICQKAFCCLKNLSNHSEVHNRKGSFPCDICDELFTNKFNLYMHYFLHTKYVPFFICSICFKIFSRRNNWVSHYCTHVGTKPYFCEICNKQFVKKRHLYLHCRIHTDEKPYFCELCNKSFKYYNTMIMHQHIHDTKDL